MLDCQTNTGREYIAKQHRLIQWFGRTYNVETATTADDLPGAVDVAFSRDGQLTGLGEIKVRNMSLETLQKVHNGLYLVTNDKLVGGINLAKQLTVPFFLIVGLDDAVVWWKCSTRAGQQIQSWDALETMTQATCNGGKATRVNAYLPTSGATIVRGRW